MLDSIKKKIKDSISYIYLRKCGVETKFGYVNLIGFPKIQKMKGSVIKIGKGVTLNSKFSENPIGLNHRVIISTLSKDAFIHIKDYSGMSGSAIVCVKKIEIGEFSGLGANSKVVDTDFHPIDPILRRNQKSILDANSMPVKIGRDVLIGANSLILKGVTIGDGVFVGANSVVIKSINEYTVAGGNPAKVIREISKNLEEK